MFFWLFPSYYWLHRYKQFIFFSHQEGSDGAASDETSQNIIPVVSVLSHSYYSHQHGQRQQRQAQGGLRQTGPFGSEHEGNVHLQENNEKVRFCLGSVSRGLGFKTAKMREKSMSIVMLLKNWIFILALELKLLLCMR